MLVAGTLVDAAFPAHDESKSSAAIVAEVSAQVVALVVVIYYIRKAVVAAPFALALTSRYVPGMKGESASGTIIGTMGLIPSQRGLILKIVTLRGRLWRGTSVG